MRWHLVIAALIICAILTPVVPAFAAPPASPGPDDAAPLVGIQTGTLEVGKDRWFTFWDGGTSKPLGVTLNYDPAPPVDDTHVTFIVWVYTKQGLDARLAQVGRGTGVEQASGVKYWRGGSNVARNYYVQVVNNSAGNIDYAIALTGDTYPPPGLGGSDVAAREILSKAIASQGNIKTVQTDIDMRLSLGISGGRESMSMDMAMSGQAAIDYDNKRMKMNMKMSMLSPQSPLGEQMDIDMNVYVLGKWMYMKVASAAGLPGMNEGWIKAPADEQIWNTWTSQQTMFSREAARVRLMGTEPLDGVPCYVLDIKPGKEVVQSLLAQQPLGGAGDDFSRLGLEKLFDTMSMKVWVARDTYFITKQELNWPMELKASDIDPKEQSFDKLTMNLVYRMKLYGYNQPVSIQLPPEAADAAEVPGAIAPVPGARPPR